MDIRALDQVNAPFTCRPCDIRFVPFTCSESYQVLPVGELVVVMVLNCGNGRSALSSVFEVE